MKILPAILTSCLTTFSFLSYSPTLEAARLPTDVSQKSKPLTVKVLLAQGESKILLEVKGRYNIYNPDDELLMLSSASGKLDWLSYSENGLRWGDLLHGVFQMRIVPGDSQTTILINGTQYRGCVEIYVADQTLNVVNEIDLENYLKATLGTHSTHSLNREVMDALAIVARTDAYYHTQRAPSHAFWHVRAQEVGYHGYALTTRNPHMDHAIDTTRQMILTYQNAPFATTWTENSAGKTANFSTIFRRKTPTPSGVEIPLAAKNREKFAWSFQISKQQLANLVQLSGVKHVDLHLDQESNKVYGVKITNGKEIKHLSFLELQKILGNQKLRSSDFTISLKGDKIFFEGFGQGPGVGLCLYAAQIMAEHGEKTPKILSTFYPQTELINASNWYKTKLAP